MEVPLRLTFTSLKSQHALVYLFGRLPMNENVEKKDFLEFTCLTTPRISLDLAVDFAQGRIKLTQQGRILIKATDKEHADSLLDIFVGVVGEIEPSIRAWLFEEVGHPKTYHPSQPNWAYSQIPIEKIPVVELSDLQIRVIKTELEKYKTPDFWPDDPSKIEGSRIFWP